jgi:hypothetical protein
MQPLYSFSTAKKSWIKLEDSLIAIPFKVAVLSAIGSQPLKDNLQVNW